MADIYVRPYGSPSRRPFRRLLLAGVLIVAAGAVVWHLVSRTETERESEPDVSRTVVETGDVERPHGRATPATAPGAEADVLRLFSQARDALEAGRLRDASELLGQVIKRTADAGVRNSAWRLQGRAHMELFLSNRPEPEKTSYVIQPGDSLDRIARRNKTTVELIRRMNGIEGSLIYPGHRILLPATPLRVEVDKTARTLDVWVGDWLLKRYAVGVGRDGRTPSGTFRTVVHQMNPDWTPPGGGIIPFGDPRNELGTRWMSIHDSTRPELTGFGIHGTTERDSIGMDTSNGCIRMLNEDVEELYMLIPQGTEVRIRD